jgi:carboxymethylenebutenolidase
MDGDETVGSPGHLALREEGGPAVLLVHDEHGLLPHVRQRCEDLAEAGFVAFAPDLYGGRATRDPREAAALRAGLDDARVERQLAEAARALRALRWVHPPGCAAIGFSVGGDLVLRLAGSGVLNAAIAFYAALGPREGAAARCPVLLLLAASDPFLEPGQAQAFLAAARSAGQPAEDVTYPGTEHWFANGDVAAWSPLAAGRAWARTLNFLRAHLG